MLSLLQDYQDAAGDMNTPFDASGCHKHLAMRNMLPYIEHPKI